VSDPEMQLLLEFSDRASAVLVATYLESEGVTTAIDCGSLFSGVQANFHLFVEASLAHRARWILAQSEFTDSELNFLSTGELGEPGSNT
jgi:hypothetical protein